MKYNSSYARLFQRIKQYLAFFKYIFPYWDKVLAVLLGTIFASFSGLFNPYLTKLTIDYAYGNKDLVLFTVFIGAGLLVFFFSTLTGIIEQYLRTYIRLRIGFDFRAEFYKHLHKLSLRFFQSRSTGEQVYRLDSDLDTVVNLIIEMPPLILTSLFRLVSISVIILWLDWRFALIVLLLMPIFLTHTAYFTRYQRRLTKQYITQSQWISTNLFDSLSQIKLIKSFGKEKTAVKEYLSGWISRIRLSFRRLGIDIASSTTASLLNTIIITGITYYLGYQVISGILSLGDIIALSMYFLQLFGLATSLGGIYQSLAIQFISLDRVLETLDAPIEIQEKKHAIAINRIHGEIQFCEVTFGYNSPTPVLQKFTSTIDPGTTVAFFGPSGVGKTTIVSLLLRLYDPWEGKIYLDGYDLRDLKLFPIKSQIGVALQEPYLFNVSIGENIRYGNPEATDTEVIHAAQTADIHEFISQLPNGYETRIGEAGCYLSMGQRQRICIARALIKKPRILILDEATSSLSLASECKILNSIHQLDELTTIIISHRPSALAHANKIFIIQDGTIVTEGNHQELLNTNQLYRTMYATQEVNEREINEIVSKI
ncbi:MAG: ABC transporter ATP-binding protein [bacterium]|nr:ABC transporter ATP-binding protein [bacterium]